MQLNKKFKGDLVTVNKHSYDNNDRCKYTIYSIHICRGVMWNVFEVIFMNKIFDSRVLLIVLFSPTVFESLELSFNPKRQTPYLLSSR